MICDSVAKSSTRRTNLVNRLHILINAVTHASKCIITYCTGVVFSTEYTYIYACCKYNVDVTGIIVSYFHLCDTVLVLVTSL